MGWLKDLKHKPDLKQMLLHLLVLSFLMLIGILTTLAILYFQEVQIRSLLENDEKQNCLKVIETGDGSDALVINSNIETEKLSAREKITFEQIKANKIKLSSSDGSNLHLDSSGIKFNAAQYHVGPNEPLEFYLDDKQEKVEVSNGIKNIGLIRAPETKQNNKLEVVSGDKLEMSGNLGLRIHSAEPLRIESPQKVVVESREESIDLSGAEGVRLPLVPHEEELGEKQNEGAEQTMSPNPAIAGKIHLCIDKSNGRISSSTDSC